MAKSVMIIPSMNPDEGLINYVKELIVHQFTKIIIIDDGSCQETKHIFTKLQFFKECIILPTLFDTDGMFCRIRVAIM